MALALLNQLAVRCPKRAFSSWWKAAAAERLTKIPASALRYLRFWDAMDAVTLEQLEEIPTTLAAPSSPGYSRGFGLTGAPTVESAPDLGR